MNNKEKQVQRYIKNSKKQTRKQMLREARRKSDSRNQQKRPRQKKIDLYDWDDPDDQILGVYERVMPKGDRERRKEVENKTFTENRRPGSRSEEDNSRNTEEGPGIDGFRGVVVETSSSMCRVNLDGELFLCDIRGNIKNAETRYINAVAVGDQVTISKNGDDRGIVETVHLRRNVLARPYSPDVGKIIQDLEQIIVANVDRLLIVASWREPFIWPALIDRYLITAQRNNIEAVICINKTDLIEDWENFDSIIQTYQALELRLINTSVITGDGIELLAKLLGDGTTVLAGLSGVGKSSLLTAVQPTLDIKTSHVSEHGLFTGQGRHTTTQSRLWKLDDGGIVVDTPGVRSFGISRIAPSDLASWYPEMSPHIQNCRFGNCSHITEPNCGVKAAVATGSVTPLRYKNYTQIFEELSN